MTSRVSRVLCFRLSCKIVRQVFADHRALFSTGGKFGSESVKSRSHWRTTVVCQPFPCKWQYLPVFNPSFPRVKVQWAGSGLLPLFFDQSRISFEAFFIRAATSWITCIRNVKCTCRKAQISCSRGTFRPAKAPVLKRMSKALDARSRPVPKFQICKMSRPTVAKENSEASKLLGELSMDK